MTARKPGRAWTERDTTAMLALVARNWTDGEIARALGVVRLTVWRRRTALGLDRADHPRKENRPLARQTPGNLSSLACARDEGHALLQAMATGLLLGR